MYILAHLLTHKYVPSIIPVVKHESSVLGGRRLPYSSPSGWSSAQCFIYGPYLRRCHRRHRPSFFSLSLPHHSGSSDADVHYNPGRQLTASSRLTASVWLPWLRRRRRCRRRSRLGARRSGAPAPGAPRARGRGAISPPELRLKRREIDRFGPRPEIDVNGPRRRRM